MKAVRYQDLIASHRPRTAPPTPPRVRGYPPSLARPPANRLWTTTASGNSGYMDTPERPITLTSAGRKCWGRGAPERSVFAVSRSPELMRRAAQLAGRRELDRSGFLCRQPTAADRGSALSGAGVCRASCARRHRRRCGTESCGVAAEFDPDDALALVRRCVFLDVLEHQRYSFSGLFVNKYGLKWAGNVRSPDEVPLRMLRLTRVAAMAALLPCRSRKSGADVWASACPGHGGQGLLAAERSSRSKHPPHTAGSQVGRAWNAGPRPWRR